MRKNQVIEHVERLLDSIADRVGVSVVDVEMARESGHHYLRVCIDKPNGINTADCEAVSRELGSALDEAAVIPMAYTLEVSSPGIERVLKKDREFSHFAGRTLDVTLFAPSEVGRRFRATLLGIDAGTVSFSLDDDRVLTLPRTKIAKASLALVAKGGEQR